jgi:hypothetical protein
MSAAWRRKRVKELMGEWRALRFGLSEEEAAEAWAESIADHEDGCPALAATPAPETSGTTTDCPLVGVHEHAFRGPHRFREWDPELEAR